MANEHTGPDALRVYLTGAATDGGSQVYDNLSLGGYRSSEELEPLGHSLYDVISGVRIDHVAGANGEGNGTLHAVDTSKLQWTPPGGSVGSPVTIANGESKVISGNDASKYIRVTRTSATNLRGTMTVALSHVYNNAVGMYNVSSAEATAGEVEYRCLCFRNGGTAAIAGLKVWVDASEGSGIAIGMQTPDSPSSGSFSDLSVFGQGVQAPPGVSWRAGTTAGTGLSIPTLSAGQIYGVWIRRTIAASAAASARTRSTIHWSWGSYTGEASGQYRIADDSLVGYEVYLGTDAEPDLDGAAWETSATLPWTTTATLAAGHTYYLRGAYRNAYDLVSFDPESTVITILGDGSEDATRPSGPDEVSVEAASAGAVHVEAWYAYLADGDDAADAWLVYYTTDGDDPDPATDTPTEVSMVQVDGLAYLDWTSAALGDGLTVKVLVRTRRSGTPDVDSDNTTIYSATTSTSGPSAVDVACQWDVENATVTTSTIWQSGTDARIDHEDEPGVLRFYVGGNLVAGIGAAQTLYLKGNVQFLPFGSNTAQTAVVDYVGGKITFAAGDTGSRYRIMALDASGNLQVASVVERSDYPITDQSFTENIEWHSGETALEFSTDLTQTAMRLLRTESGGVYNGTLYLREIRENAIP